MKMKVVKKTEMFTIYVKSSGRFAVKDANKNWINAEEKVTNVEENVFLQAFDPPEKKETDDEDQRKEAPAAEAPAAEAPAEDAPEEETKLKSASKAKAKESPKAKPKTKAKTES